jgi:outer membrane protein insertion porin family
MTTFAYKLKAGSIINYRGDKLDIPVNNRFYGGGSNSIRGWKSRDLVPSSPAFEIGENTTNEDIEAIIKKVSPGGFLLLEGSFEMRNRWGDNFVTAVFLDYGNTWNELPEISLKTVAVSAGMGFRIYTPFVPPVRFDFGFKIYDPYKKKLDLNKTIGDLFKENFEIQFGFGEAF